MIVVTNRQQRQARLEGPNVFDALSAVEEWREKGKAPAEILASKVTDDHVVRTRPLCPYPTRIMWNELLSIWFRARLKASRYVLGDATLAAGRQRARTVPSAVARTRRN